MSCLLACRATTSTTRSWPGARSHKQEGHDRTWSPNGPMALPHLHLVMPARSERGRRRRSCTARHQLQQKSKIKFQTAPLRSCNPVSIHEGGSEHGSMTSSRRSIECKHDTLLRLGEDNSTWSWGGSIEATKPTGTLSDGREAPLRTGLALTNLSRLMWQYSKVATRKSL